MKLLNYVTKEDAIKDWQEIVQCIKEAGKGYKDDFLTNEMFKLTIDTSNHLFNIGYRKEMSRAYDNEIAQARKEVELQ